MVYPRTDNPYLLMLIYVHWYISMTIIQPLRCVRCFHFQSLLDWSSYVVHRHSFAFFFRSSCSFDAVSFSFTSVWVACLVLWCCASVDALCAYLAVLVCISCMCWLLGLLVPLYSLSSQGLTMDYHLTCSSCTHFILFISGTSDSYLGYYSLPFFYGAGGVLEIMPQVISSI